MNQIALKLSMLLIIAAPVYAQRFEQSAALRANDVVWTDAGRGPDDSMPLGNGDIGLNVWTELNGDLLFYIGKTDAWTESPARSRGLAKVGRIRVSLFPRPDVASGFEQALRLADGQIVIKEGGSILRVWVDANHPVIHVAAQSVSPVTMTVGLEVWRKETFEPEHISPDVVELNRINELLWYHHDGLKSDPHVKDWTFGGLVRGAGLIGSGTELKSERPARDQQVSIQILAMTAPDPKEWETAIAAQATEIDKLASAKVWQSHVQWWRDFWNRSWIYVQGNASAVATTQGYVLQRFKSAIAGRGRNAIKFNGSLFVVDNPSVEIGRDAEKKPIMGPVTADYRGWGGQYWFQNTRPIYWPMLAQGDFDEMLPLFKQVRDMIPFNSGIIQKNYGHDGFYFAETAPFFGGVGNFQPETKGQYTDFHFTPVLELSMMMLDYYEYTGDAAFAKDTLLPVASGGMTFFDKHWKRDEQGKLLLDPDNAIEMFWKVHNPAPDIAGLLAVLPRLLALPANLTTPALRVQWARLLGEVPPLPTGPKAGTTVLLPYTGEQIQPSHNTENPELYAIYPFRLFGLGKSDFQLGKDTFEQRVIKATGCWVQDPIQAAYLGDAALAQKDVAFNLQRKDKRMKFPAFWDKGHDYIPDEDNGGNGELGLEKMLLQDDGGKLLLLPSWPRNWNADFKLHAAHQTVVEGRVEAGKLVDIRVTPASRKADLVIMNAQP